MSDNLSATPTFTAPDVGSSGETLIFRLTVTDPSGLEATATTNVNVKNPNQPPVADAGPDQTVNGSQVVILDGSGSHDPDPLTYLWQQAASDPVQVTLSDPTAVNPSFTAPSGLSQDTALTFNLVVNDGHVDSAISSVVIPVTKSIPGNSNFTGAGGGGCFIATAAYGSLLELHVKILRAFRDRFFIGNMAGDYFIHLYYTYSPPIADFIAKHDSLRTIVRVSLFPVVAISWVVLRIGPLPAVALMFIFMSCVAALVWYRRRHKR